MENKERMNKQMEKKGGSSRAVMLLSYVEMAAVGWAVTLGVSLPLCCMEFLQQWCMQAAAAPGFPCSAEFSDGL